MYIYISSRVPPTVCPPTASASLFSLLWLWYSSRWTIELPSQEIYLEPSAWLHSVYYGAANKVLLFGQIKPKAAAFCWSHQRQHWSARDALNSSLASEEWTTNSSSLWIYCEVLPKIISTPVSPPTPHLPSNYIKDALAHLAPDKSNCHFRRRTRVKWGFQEIWTQTDF